MESIDTYLEKKKKRVEIVNGSAQKAKTVAEQTSSVLKKMKKMHTPATETKVSDLSHLSKLVLFAWQVLFFISINLTELTLQLRLCIFLVNPVPYEANLQIIQAWRGCSSWYNTQK